VYPPELPASELPAPGLPAGEPASRGAAGGAPRAEAGPDARSAGTRSAGARVAGALPGWGVTEAVAAVEAGLAVLASADAAALPSDTLAWCLHALGRAESAHLAARSRLLAAFTAQDASVADGQPTTRSWLRWQTRVTLSAATTEVGWMKRLAAHPRVAAALAASEISPSWARQVCDWTDKLPAGVRDAADEILLTAASGGAGLADLSGLAREMYERTAPPEPDDSPAGPDDGYDDRWLRLDLHFRGAGRLEGSLTPECAAAVAALLDALGKKAGPEDDRSAGQRNHDALEEAARMLLATGTLPDIAGQPARLLVHATLDQILGRLAATAPLTPTEPPGSRAAHAAPGGATAGSARAGSATPGGPAPGGATAGGATAGSATPGGPAPGGATAGGARAGSATAGGPAPGGATAGGATAGSATAGSATPGSATAGGPAGRHPASRDADRRADGGAGGMGADPGVAGAAGPPPPPGFGDYRAGEADAFAAGRAAGDGEAGWLSSAVAAQAYACDAKIATVITGQLDPEAVAAAVRAYLAEPGPGAPPGGAGAHHGAGTQPGAGRLGATLARYATAMLSGPTGLAAALRSGLPGPIGAGVSLPLEVSSATSAVPPHLRRAVIVRDRCCAFPGCHRQPGRCQVHHVVPRSQGGPTALHNLVLLCSFHHLYLIHRRGWTLTLNADGTTTAASPDGGKILRSHAPPAAA
jgi:Domain of unknown function (DUF222)/HNH endonuclease